MTQGNVRPITDKGLEVTPLMDPETYGLTLEFLMAHGEPAGKTKSVAAYFFNPLAFFDRKGEPESFLSDESGGEKHHFLEGAKPLYIVMDLGLWPEHNEYGRQLCIRKIFDKLAQRVLDEESINNPVFEAPGVWTTKELPFRRDYVRRQDTEELSGKRVNIWDPNKEAYRLCVRVTDNLKIPATWGTQELHKGAVLAIREREMAAVESALLDIRHGRASSSEALFKTNEDGKKVARFDVYGMDPGFCEANYSKVTIKPETNEIQHRMQSLLAQEPVQDLSVAKFSFPETEDITQQARTDQPSFYIEPSNTG